MLLHKREGLHSREQGLEQLSAQGPAHFIQGLIVGKHMCETAKMDGKIASAECPPD